MERARADVALNYEGPAGALRRYQDAGPFPSRERERGCLTYEIAVHQSAPQGTAAPSARDLGPKALWPTQGLTRPSKVLTNLTVAKRGVRLSGGSSVTARVVTRVVSIGRATRKWRPNDGRRQCWNPQDVAYLWHGTGTREYDGR